MTALDCQALGVRYQKKWALRDCTLALPDGHVVGLVGPNGAGKTTLLHCIVGLLAPTTGTVAVVAGLPAGSRGARRRVGFVAQDAPLYGHLTVADMIRLTAALNGVIDRRLVASRLTELDIASSLKIGSLSGGQRAQLALTLALGRHPELLVLDEPLARLDPLARRAFMSVLLTAAGDEGTTIVFSTHDISELERVADYLVLLTGGRVRVAAPIDDLPATHRVVSGPVETASQVAHEYRAIRADNGSRLAQLLVPSPDGLPHGWSAASASLEEIVLAYLAGRGDEAAWPDCWPTEAAMQ